MSFYSPMRRPVARVRNVVPNDVQQLPERIDLVIEEEGGRLVVVARLLEWAKVMALHRLQHHPGLLQTLKMLAAEAMKASHGDADREDVQEAAGLALSPPAIPDYPPGMLESLNATEPWFRLHGARNILNQNSELRIPFDSLPDVLQVVIACHYRMTGDNSSPHRTGDLSRLQQWLLGRLRLDGRPDRVEPERLVDYAVTTPVEFIAVLALLASAGVHLLVPVDDIGHASAGQRFYVFRRYARLIGGEVKGIELCFYDPLDGVWLMHHRGFTFGSEQILSFGELVAGAGLKVASAEIPHVELRQRHGMKDGHHFDCTRVVIPVPVPGSTRWSLAGHSRPRMRITVTRTLEHPAAVLPTGDIGAEVAAEAAFVSQWLAQVSQADGSALDAAQHGFDLAARENDAVRIDTVDTTTFLPLVRCWIPDRRTYGYADVRDLRPASFESKALDLVEMKQTHRELLRRLATTARQAYARTPATVFLLHGPPGTGKTSTVHAFAEESQTPAVIMHASDLTSPYQTGTGVDVARFVTTGNQDEVALQTWRHRVEQLSFLLALEEADQLLLDRSLSPMQASLLPRFLQFLDEMPGFIFLTTNRPEVLDPAVLSRVAVHMHFPALGAEARTRIWQRKVREFARTELPDATVQELGRLQLDGRQIHNTAAMLAGAFGKDWLETATAADIAGFVSSIQERPEHDPRRYGSYPTVPADSPPSPVGYTTGAVMAMDT